MSNFGSSGQIDSPNTSPRSDFKAKTPGDFNFKTPNDGSFKSGMGEGGKDETESVKERNPIRKDAKSVNY